MRAWSMTVPRFGVARFEQRRFRRDVDALGDAADAELRVDRRRPG